MVDLNPVTSQLMFVTVRVECESPNGASTGTAFFFDYLLNGKSELPMLMTNKHVVEGATSNRFRVHTAATPLTADLKPSGQFTDITLVDQQWLMHPDPDIDLCAIPVAPLLELARKQGHEIFRKAIKEGIVPFQTALNELPAMQNVVMVGYPTGLWDSANNLPILRRGVTASHPALRFGGKQQGVVDIASFPGSSGSPIFAHDEIGFHSRNGFVFEQRIHFLGILFAGPQYRADGTVEVVEIPTHAVAVSQTHIPIHLGYYIRSAALVDFKTFVRSKLNC